MKLELDGFSQERVERLLCEHLAERCDELLTSTLRTKVEEAVARAVDAVVEPRVREVVEAVLLEGWQRTNGYGEPSGKRVTLKERVGEWISAKDTFNGKRQIDKVFEGLIAELVNRELRDELSAVRKQFRAEADAVLKAKLVESLRAAIGLA